MAYIQSAAAEIRRGKKEEERRKNKHSIKIYMVSLFHRATINKSSAVAEMGAHLVTIDMGQKLGALLL